MKKLLEQIGTSLREGNPAHARELLRAIRPTSIRRSHLALVANFARRCDLPNLALALLNPFVRSTSSLHGPASVQERAIYAGALIKIGAVEEAMVILKSLEGKLSPEVLLFSAHAHMAQWNYQASVPILERYTALPELDSHQRLVGKVNLAAALVHEKDWERSERLLREIRDEATSLGDQILKVNCLELSAQQAVHRKQWAAARECLNEAETLLGRREGLDALFVLKWKTFLKLEQKGKWDPGPMAELRFRAEKMHHWETLRDCDLLQAKLTSDRGLLLHAYFGSPFESFRKRIILELDRPMDVPSHYWWSLSGSGEKGPAIDLFSSMWSGHKWAWRPGSTLYRAFSVLVSDFYRPFSPGLMFSQVYPGEFFNPTSSPGRVHQVIRGLRQFFSRHRVPLKVAASRSGYRLVAAPACRLRIPRDLRSRSAGSNALATLEAVVVQSEFTSAEAGRVLQMSRSAVGRFLKSAVERGELSSLGSGKGTRYFFAKSKAVPERD